MIEQVELVYRYAEDGVIFAGLEIDGASTPVPVQLEIEQWTRLIIAANSPLGLKLNVRLAEESEG